MQLLGISSLIDTIAPFHYHCCEIHIFLISIISPVPAFSRIVRIEKCTNLPFSSCSHLIVGRGKPNYLAALAEILSLSLPGIDTLDNKSPFFCASAAYNWAAESLFRTACPGRSSFHRYQIPAAQSAAAVHSALRLTPYSIV